jgi:hypothetical protein
MKNKKTNEKVERIRRFWEEIVPEIENDFTTKRYQHFLKIEIGSKVFDYYPGAQSIRLVVEDRPISKSDWQEMNVETFYESLKQIMSHTKTF